MSKNFTGGFFLYGFIGRQYPGSNSSSSATVITRFPSKLKGYSCRKLVKKNCQNGKIT